MCKLLKLVAIALLLTSNCRALPFECPAKCECGTVKVSCIDAGYTEVPAITPGLTAAVINLDGNSIAELKKDSFSNYDIVVDISLNANQLTTIHPDAFRELKNLETLSLSDNKFTELNPNLFSNNVKLETVFLNTNTHWRVQSGPLLNVPSVKRLYIAGANITGLTDESFRGLPNLEMLDLSSNHFLNPLNPKAIYPLKKLKILILPSQPSNTLEDLCKNVNIEYICIDDCGNKQTCANFQTTTSTTTTPASTKVSSGSAVSTEHVLIGTILASMIHLLFYAL